MMYDDAAKKNAREVLEAFLTKFCDVNAPELVAYWWPAPKGKASDYERERLRNALKVALEEDVVSVADYKQWTGDNEYPTEVLLEGRLEELYDELFGAD